MIIKSTKDIIQNGYNILLYGQEGIGKTYSTIFTQRPLIISLEGGLRTLSGYDLPYLEVFKMQDFENILNWLNGGQGSENYQTIIIDSVSQLSWMALSEIGAGEKDGRKTYGKMADKMIYWLDILCGKNGMFPYLDRYDVVALAKLDKVQNETGEMMYDPRFEGGATSTYARHIFDAVLALRWGHDAKGVKYRYLQSEGDTAWSAKARVPFPIPPMHAPDVGQFINLVKGNVQNG